LPRWGLSTKPNVKYEGEWLNGKKHGNGKLEWGNGDTYEGSFVDDMRVRISNTFDLM
jgi:hypothetical protein